MKSTESMPISEFKATCLAVLERVRRTGQRIVITRRGEAVAEVGPPPQAEPRADWLGDLRDEARIVGDIMGPAADPSDWSALSQ